MRADRRYFSLRDLVRSNQFWSGCFWLGSWCGPSAGEANVWDRFEDSELLQIQLDFLASVLC